MRRLMMLAATGLLVAACAGVGVPNFTIPPINIPSFSIPPFEIPSGITIPSADGSTGTCAWATTAEVGSIMGATPTITENSGTSCTYTFPNFSAVVVSTDSGSDLNTSKMLFGESAKDIQVGGLPAASGTFIGQPAVHVQRGADQLQVLGILTGSDDATIQKLVQIATLAVSRWQ
jgi:hypothetical protein